MTRFLSQSLHAKEPYFRQGLQKLEAANGHKSTDIRLSTEVMRETRTKIIALGLNPATATTEEIYSALERRVAQDDALLNRNLRTRAATHVSAEADVISGMIHVLNESADSKRCYALKGSVLKSLIKKQPPKKAMKQLGYRSLASFMKHESAVSILAAAWLTESSAWQKKLLHQYKTLKSGDFENRSIILFQPDSLKWRILGEKIVAQQHHNLLSFKELGALVFLPLDHNAPAGATTVSLTMALHELNEIRASSTYFKLCQVRPDFGSIVRDVVREQPQLHSDLLDRPVPWNLIQRYYSRLSHHLDEQVFEPHLQLDEMVWHPIESTLGAIESRLAFWEDNSHLGILNGEHPVSFNLIDVALNYCNNIPFERRIVSHYQQSLWHELMLRYMRHDSVEQSVIKELQPQYAAELAVS